jgi:hypothetical protein
MHAWRQHTGCRAKVTSDQIQIRSAHDGSCVHRTCDHEAAGGRAAGQGGLGDAVHDVELQGVVVACRETEQHQCKV